MAIGFAPLFRCLGNGGGWGEGGETYGVGGGGRPPLGSRNFFKDFLLLKPHLKMKDTNVPPVSAGVCTKIMNPVPQNVMRNIGLLK